MPAGRLQLVSKGKLQKNYPTVVKKDKKISKEIKDLKLNPTVARLVDRRINKKSEDHAVGLHYRRRLWANIMTGATVTNRVVGLLPNIPTASSRADREGAEITLRSMVINGMITIPADDTPYFGNADRADIVLRLCCLSCKKYQNIDTIQNNWLAGDLLFQKMLKGAQIAQAPTGNVVDMWEPINRQVFTVHYDKVFHLKRGVCLPAAQVPPSDQGLSHMPAINKPFRIRLKVKNKKLYFNESTDQNPSNFAPFIVGWWGYSNGASPSTSAVPFVEHYTQTYFKP